MGNCDKKTPLPPTKTVVLHSFPPFLKSVYFCLVVVLFWVFALGGEALQASSRRYARYCRVCVCLSHYVSLSGHYGEQYDGKQRHKKPQTVFPPPCLFLSCFCSISVVCGGRRYARSCCVCVPLPLCLPIGPIQANMGNCACGGTKVDGGSSTPVEPSKKVGGNEEMRRVCVCLCRCGVSGWVCVCVCVCVCMRVPCILCFFPVFFSPPPPFSRRFPLSSPSAHTRASV